MEQFGSGQQNNNEILQMTRNLTQIQLAFEEDEPLLSWIEKHAKDFDELTKRDPFILEELAEKGTHDEAIERVKKEIYH
ncbi:MAG: hypothetical protein M0P64_01750 [Candidatus Pacebacteria bacterium]|nr:hypothetical protein [Candidatus Paceibacterota bacterium]